MPQIFDMGQTALLPLRMKARCEFFHQKNPTASAGTEPALLGICGQHAKKGIILNISWQHFRLYDRRVRTSVLKLQYIQMPMEIATVVVCSS
jgi:hypothetical protein